MEVLNLLWKRLLLSSPVTTVVNLLWKLTHPITLILFRMC